MLFLESWFWVFAGVAVPAYLVAPRALKIHALLIASAVFQYHFAGPAGMAPIIALALLTYVAGLGRIRLPALSIPRLTVALVIGALCFYKYSEFLAQNAVGVLSALPLRLAEATAGLVRSWEQPAAPLGISFFTFEFLHYLYEVRVNGRAPIRNPVHFAIFAIFFPCLAAGPIKRFPDFVPQLAALRNPGAADFLAGLRRVIRGMFKKVCIADLLVEYIGVFEQVETYTAPVVIALALLQGLRIYYDFAGYSDMAIGLAQMVNLRVPENFTRPYGATSLREFWRRWHISLSTWIRDYIYIPLGGNRGRRAFNLLAAMVLCGLWHGASWNFALWGVYHGLGLVVEAGVRRARPGWFGDAIGQRVMGWAICYVYVMYGWLLFFYPIETVFAMTRGLLRWG